ncbi:hypothetical protein [Halalkalibacter lacteus]|uniref:YqgU-like beta propeller domain-containing protein n=1 Tax=Halalkalibacter lacteus TaxID=3090663 RepID=UPI002FCA2BA6
MKHLIVSIFVLFTVSACAQAPTLILPAPKSLSELPAKSNVPSSFFTGSIMTPIQNKLPIIEVASWYDKDTVLFLQEENEQFSLHKHNLFLGESSVFLEEDGWIIDVRANADYSLFAVQYLSLEEQSQLLILNDQGGIIWTIKDYGEEYTIYWNPYDTQTFVMVAYLPNWEFETYVGNVEEKKITDIGLEESYIQWVSESKVGYLKWEELEPNFQAPLYELDIENGETNRWKDTVIAFMAFPDGLSLSVTVDSIYDLYSVYRFYDEQKPYRKIEMPILNTYSEQWWIPYYSYDHNNGIFYYLRPKYSSDYFSYEDGYELIAYNVRADSEEKLISLEKHVPLSISPGGSILLIGERYEFGYDIQEGALVPMWEE